VQGLHLGAPCAHNDAAGGQVVGALERLRRASADAPLFEGVGGRYVVGAFEREGWGEGGCGGIVPPTSWGQPSLLSSSRRCNGNEQDGPQETSTCDRYEAQSHPHKAAVHRMNAINRTRTRAETRIAIKSTQHQPNALLHMLQANVKTLGNEAVSDLLVDDDADGAGGDVPHASRATVVELVRHTCRRARVTRSAKIRTKRRSCVPL
jgi:hypothetical protein